MRDYLKGKKCMVWSFMGNARMYQALRDYGDRLDTVGIFTFEVNISGAITETGWPHQVAAHDHEPWDGLYFYGVTQ